MGERFRVDYLGEMRWGVIDTANGRLVGIDGGEPEDQLLCRDWKWVPEELNRLAATLAARDERIRELEAEAERVTSDRNRLLAVAIESLRQTKEADARIATMERELAEARTDCHDRNHVGLREVLCGARLPDASLGQDAALAAHLLGAMEAELAEARQREEDANDLILRQGRELDAMRPKAEAAERRAEALRVIGDVHQIGVLMGEADRAILAACPEKGGAW